MRLIEQTVRLKMNVLSEERVAKILMRHALDRQCIAIPNTKAIWKRFESDVIVISKSDSICELEIKLSRSDFLADKKKVSKHTRLLSGKCPVNRFSYACPEGLIQLSDIPSYAGLVWIIDGMPVVQKKAPMLNSVKLSTTTKDRMFRSLAWKWAK